MDEEEQLKLNLSFRKLDQLPLDVILENPTATSLQIYLNSLTTFPAELAQLSRLEELIAWQNSFPKFPEVICKLKNLKKLSLSSNFIPSIPSGVSSLGSLTLLELSCNRLEVLPEEFKFLTNITSLSLFSNRLTEFPKQISRFTKLEKLNLSENNLGSVPSKIGSFTPLTELHISQCNLSSLPKSISKLTNLKSFWAESNFISEVPSCYSSLQSLSNIYLDYNDLTTIPNFIYSIKNLSLVSVGGCKTQFTPESFQTGVKFRVNAKAQEADMIIKGLYLGSATSAKNRHFLERNNITCVLTIMDEPQTIFPNKFKYLFLKARDERDQDIKSFFPDAHNFIEEARKEGGVLVHCAMGVSRSASIVISYIMQSKKINFREAYDFVKLRREVIFPNAGFVEQLEAYEKSLQTKNHENCRIS